MVKSSITAARSSSSSLLDEDELRWCKRYKIQGVEWNLHVALCYPLLAAFIKFRHYTYITTDGFNLVCCVVAEPARRGGQTWFFFLSFFFTLMWAGSCSSPCERVLRLAPIKPLFVAKVVKGQRRWHFNGAAPIQPFNVVTGRCRRLWTNHIAERGRGQTGCWLAADTSNWSLHNCGCTEPKIKHLFVFQYMSSIFIYLFIFLMYLLRNKVNLTSFF